MVTEEMKVKGKIPGSKYKSYIHRDNKGSKYLKSRTARCNSVLEIDSDILVIEKLANFDDLFYKDILKAILGLNKSISSMMDISRAFEGIRITDQNEHKIGFDGGENVKQFLFLLKKEKQKKYNLLINSLKDLIPTIEAIEAKEIDFLPQKEIEKIKPIPFTLPEKVYEIMVKERFNNQFTTSRYLSRGTLRILMILTAAVDAEERGVSILGIEEFENSIHPQLMQRLLIILSELAPSVKIIISSHSPHLIQYLNLNSIYFGIPDDNCVANFKKIKESKHNFLIKYAQEIETSLGDLLFELMMGDSINGINLKECLA